MTVDMFDVGHSQKLLGSATLHSSVKPSALKEQKAKWYVAVWRSVRVIYKHPTQHERWAERTALCKANSIRRRKAYPSLGARMDSNWWRNSILRSSATWRTSLKSSRPARGYGIITQRAEEFYNKAIGN